MFLLQITHQQQYEKDKGASGTESPYEKDASLAYVLHVTKGETEGLPREVIANDPTYAQALKRADENPQDEIIQETIKSAQERVKTNRGWGRDGGE